MSDAETSSDNLEIEYQTWNQMKKSLQRHGFREGASDGREATFQSGFDTGYKDGFITGKALGVAKGSLDCLNSLTPNKLMKFDADDRLENPSKGSCMMCQDINFNECSLDEIIAKQKSREIKVLESIDNLKVKLKNENG